MFLVQATSDHHYNSGRWLTFVRELLSETLFCNIMGATIRNLFFFFHPPLLFWFHEGNLKQEVRWPHDSLFIKAPSQGIWPAQHYHKRFPNVCNTDISQGHDDSTKKISRFRWGQRKCFWEIKGWSHEEATLLIYNRLASKCPVIS